MSKRKIPVCSNHLSDLYKAIREEDTTRITKIEHELTDEEKCVACSYLFKTHGSTRGDFEQYLRSEGFSVNITDQSISHRTIKRWAVRLVLLSGIFTTVSILVTFLKNFLLGMKVPLLSFSIFEITLVGIISCVLFLILDDLFID